MKNHVWSTIYLLVIFLASTCQSFSPHPNAAQIYIKKFSGKWHNPFIQRKYTILHAQQLPNVDSMKASELRRELESYGISTKSFFEKSELLDAVKKAREEGRTHTSSGASTVGDAKQTSSSSTTRGKLLEEEIAKCQSMKIGELKKELEDLGISTKSFFEKSEFVRALAEARIDRVKRKTDGASSSSGSSGKKKQEEAYDPTYRDVVMQKLQIDPRDMRMGPVIDVRLAK